MIDENVDTWPSTKKQWWRFQFVGWVEDVTHHLEEMISVLFGGLQRHGCDHDMGV